MPIFLDEQLCSVLVVSVQGYLLWVVPSVAPETIAYYFGLQFKKKLLGFAFKFVSVTLAGFLCMGGVDGGQGWFSPFGYPASCPVAEFSKLVDHEQEWSRKPCMPRYL